MLLNWLVSAVALMIVAWVVPGFHVYSFTGALWAALVIGLINSTLGALLKFLTFPLTILSLGIFWWVINALMLKLATIFSPDFRINGLIPAFIGAVVLTLVQMILRWLLVPRKAD